MQKLPFFLGIFLKTVPHSEQISKILFFYSSMLEQKKPRPAPCKSRFIHRFSGIVWG